MYIKLILLVFLIGFLMIGGEIQKSDIEKGIDRDIYNYTETMIDYSSVNISTGIPMQRTKGVINIGRVSKIIESGVNFLLVSAEQVTKMGIEYGYQNPEINWKTIWKYLVYLIIIVIIVLLIKPIGYILIFIVMISILIRDKLKKGKLTNQEREETISRRLKK